MSDNKVALLCLTLIVIAGMFFKINGMENIALAVCSAIGGWIARDIKAKTGVKDE